MNSVMSEAILFKLLSVGPAFVSLILVINSVSDPVNAPKMAALGSLGFALAGVVVGTSIKRSWTESRYLLIILGFFFLGMVNSVFNSKSPLSQNLYGVYGRNTGFITYTALILVLIGALQVREIRTLKYLIYGFLFVGVINFIYCAWALLFGDFIPWNNPYKSILGLFGNPDFISAFLGMFISGLISFLVVARNKIWIRCAALIITTVAFVEIVKSHAIQGIAVTAFGIGIVVFFLIREKIKSNLGWVIYLVAAITAGVLGILGTLQIGPLSFIYKKSVSLRGSYWHAGINMGNSHPFTGVGMDSYGDSYKASRPAVALIDTPGPKVISNAAHNVFVDIFAYGGWPLFLSYVGIFAIVLISIIRVLKRSRKFEPIFVTLTVIWATYIIQSIISINQIGLAIWGWVTSGALLAYEIMTRETNFRVEALTPSSNRKIGRRNEEFITPNLTAGIGLLVGLFIAIPPLSADLKWKSALDSRDVKNVEAAMIPSYLNPASSFKYGSAVLLLSENGFNDAAYKYARIAVEFNPDYSDAWRQLYSLPQSTVKEKNEALQNIKRLDPNNPDPLGLKP